MAYRGELGESRRMNRLTVVLGAGASRDVWNGNGAHSPEWLPPLARSLFGDPRDTRQGRYTYNEIINRYRGSKNLAALISPRAQEEDFNIEQVFREYAEHPDDDVRRQYLDVPPYLRDLIVNVERNYTQSLGTHTQLVHGVLANNPHEVLFVSLNYDTYVEAALAARSSALVITSMDDYISPARPARVVKVHGSVNWGIPIGQMFGGAPNPLDWAGMVDDLSLAELATRQPIFVDEPRRDQCWTWLSRDGGRTDYLYPKLTAPLARKTADDIVCPRAHTEALKEFVRGCQKFLFIGFSALDDDVLNVLADCVHEARKFHIVSDSIEHADETKRRLGEAVRVFDLSSAELFADGFRNYVNTPDFAGI
jgi:hypothetical protein